ncbi:MULTISPECIES: heme ABC transporter substrate-binding protein IsdE [Bacillus cereus group]|uniref:heme ABC transporter substrate-binding protein IsdE n=1 Tax=Bacillus cereus group TaxID=86661 RepID=UPI0022E6169C|nr:MULTISPECIES: heme ABC transporter substrate-binding protein IsdE [unclassified Bacillus cereus group]MDA2666110.1 heme ABC transporter substrate-binding protein IsdE [Bacillus cereus group sp. Bc032]MDA2676860.1 heme ABC transporter substrate-binding protein IsdE [Bacillus cereus group sp. Bc031]MDA2682318.1 heme ABC transporter substrate-binding protein IsdE [Bacillus cereus group sp. Bc029]MDA2687804.1 heme ABC transporter substrate-binding protein IsdE [Bacillus cereus group sp. Bc030]M
MRVRKIASVLMAIILLVSIAGCSSPKKETVKQVKSESKERIVATTVAVTEIMDVLEVDLVGVPTSSKTLPKRYKGLPEVGNPMSPDMEKVQSLKPSEVLSVTTLEYELKPVFDGVGMKANFVDLTSLKNMQNSISNLGKQYGREKQAEAVVTKLDKKVASIQKEVKGKKEPTVLILLGVPGSYLVATEHSYIGDLVKQLGGKNIVQGEQVEYLASNTEYLKKADPDIILRAAHGMPDEVVKMFDKEFKTNDIWKHFAAVKNNRVYDLEERLFGTTGNLAAIEALDELKKMMYP